MLIWLFYSREVLQAPLKMSRSCLNSYCLNGGDEALDQEDSEVKKENQYFLLTGVIWEFSASESDGENLWRLIASAPTPLYLYRGRC